jgi:hypothetical protein
LRKIQTISEIETTICVQAINHRFRGLPVIIKLNRL